MNPRYRTIPVNQEPPAPPRPSTNVASPLRLALGVLGVALLAVLVTRWVEGPSVTSAAKSGANAIVIKNFSFTPARLTVVAGTTVTVTNTDQVPHTLTSGDGGFDTGEIGVGKNATIALQRLGTFTYSCQIHPSMAGTLGVK